MPRTVFYPSIHEALSLFRELSLPYISDARGAGGIPRAVENHRRKRAMVQYVDAYFKEHASFPTGNHPIDILLEDLRHSVPGADGILKAMKAPGRIVLRVVFPAD